MIHPIVTLAVVLAVGAGLALLVWRMFTRVPRITRPWTGHFWCPFKQRNVTVEFQEEAWDGKRVDLDSCSAFAPSTAVTCGRRCLDVETLPPART
ncbi:MAG: hypothetical protein HYR86_00780 [Candidatus Rokubacteria bacterium]|nr:hypothetical protein [Candidatus Rokubacteria bacterium]